MEAGRIIETGPADAAPGGAADRSAAPSDRCRARDPPRRSPPVTTPWLPLADAPPFPPRATPGSPTVWPVSSPPATTSSSSRARRQWRWRRPPRRSGAPACGRSTSSARPTAAGSGAGCAGRVPRSRISSRRRAVRSARATSPPRSPAGASAWWRSCMRRAPTASSIRSRRWRRKRSAMARFSSSMRSPPWAGTRSRSTRSASTWRWSGRRRRSAGNRGSRPSRSRPPPGSSSRRGARRPRSSRWPTSAPSGWRPGGGRCRACPRGSSSMRSPRHWPGSRPRGWGRSSAGTGAPRPLPAPGRGSLPGASGCRPAPPRTSSPPPRCRRGWTQGRSWRRRRPGTRFRPGWGRRGRGSSGSTTPARGRGWRRCWAISPCSGGRSRRSGCRSTSGRRSPPPRPPGRHESTGLTAVCAMHRVCTTYAQRIC